MLIKEFLDKINHLNNGIVGPDGVHVASHFPGLTKYEDGKDAPGIEAHINIYDENGSEYKIVEFQEDFLLGCQCPCGINLNIKKV